MFEFGIFMLFACLASLEGEGALEVIENKEKLNSNIGIAQFLFLYVSLSFSIFALQRIHSRYFVSMFSLLVCGWARRRCRENRKHVHDLYIFVNRIKNTGKMGTHRKKNMSQYNEIIE